MAFAMEDNDHGFPGETFELDGQPFEMTGLAHDRLGDMGEVEANARATRPSTSSGISFSVCTAE